MKAIQFSDYGGPEVLEYVDVPDPTPGRGEIVMQVKAASMNHLDIHFRKGLPGMKVPMPNISGSDGAGIVASVGEDVKTVAVGDRIVMNPGVACGECERCWNGEKSECHRYYVLGRETPGTHAQFVKMPAANAIPLPNDIDFETAAAAPLVYLTAWRMVVSKGKVKAGDTVLVMGAGSGVSMAAIQIAKLMGATVFTTASTEEKAKKAKELLGADEVILYTEKQLDKEVRRITNKRGVDLVIDHVGGEQWVPVLKSARNGGTVVTCGATAGFDPKEDLRQIFYRQVNVLGSTMGTDGDLMNALKLIFQKKMTPVIDSVFELKDAAKAHERMQNRKSFGKIILKP